MTDRMRSLLERIGVLLITACMLLLAPPHARAGDLSVTFAERTYTKVFEARNGPNIIIEFTANAEKIEAWTYLVSWHAFPQDPSTPAQAAQRLGQLVKQRNPQANFKAIANDKTGEAIVDFLTWAPNSDTMEFNVFRYAKGAAGLIAMQFARRFKLGSIDADEMKKIRGEAIEAMAKFDMTPLREHFARP